MAIPLVGKVKKKVPSGISIIVTFSAVFRLNRDQSVVIGDGKKNYQAKNNVPMFLCIVNTNSWNQKLITLIQQAV